MGINDGWQSTVQSEYAVSVYRDFWEECTVVENDSLGAEEHVAKILDFGDVDKIIRIGGKQIHMAQRFRKPYWSKYHDKWVDPDFTLRYSRPTSEHTIEYERLMNAYDSASAAYPRRYSFGRVYNDHERGLYELYILDTDRLIKAIKENDITEDGPITTNEGQKFMAYDLDELESQNIVVKKWTDSSEPESSRPEKPHDITSWCE